MSKEKNKLKTIDSPNYSYWSALYMAFYSRRLYVDVGKCWRGLGLLYLLITLAIFSIPYAARLTYSLNNSFKEQITGPLSKIPVFYIQNGEASFDKSMPYFIKDNDNQVVVIIDTTGQINDFTTKYPYLTILINKNKISIKVPRLQLFNMTQKVPPQGEPIVQLFDTKTNLVFDGKKLSEERPITQLTYFSQALIYPMVVTTLFSIFIVFFIVLGFLGQVFSRVFFSFEVRFMQSVRLLIVAGTPMLLVLLILLFLNYIFQGLGLILLPLLIIYYSFALYSLRAESKKIAIV